MLFFRGLPKYHFFFLNFFSWSLWIFFFSRNRRETSFCLLVILSLGMIKSSNLRNSLPWEVQRPWHRRGDDPASVVWRHPSPHRTLHSGWPWAGYCFYPARSVFPVSVPSPHRLLTLSPHLFHPSWYCISFILLPESLSEEHRSLFSFLRWRPDNCSRLQKLSVPLKPGACLHLWYQCFVLIRIRTAG